MPPETTLPVESVVPIILAKRVVVKLPATP